MRDVIGVQLATDGENRQLIREYVLPALDRLDEHAAVDSVSFVQSPSGVTLTVVGDGDAVIADESGEWDALVEEGSIVDWATSDFTEVWEHQYGSDAVELRLRLSEVANATSKAAFSEFDEAPAAVDAHPDEQSEYPIGWYSLLHQLTQQQGYSPDEELDAYLQAIELTLDNLESVTDREHVENRIDEIAEAVTTKRVDAASTE